MKKILFVALIFCLLFAVSYTCKESVKPPKFKIDHFKVYMVDTVATPLPIHIRLQDQFDRFSRSASISYIEYFANPVSKNGEKIIDSTAHFTWYRLMDDSVVTRRSVKIINQFGTFKWILDKPAYLLVPTHKIEGSVEFPDSFMIDHFKCYQVLATQSLHREVTLVDQFDKRLNRRERAIVDRPLFFCVPVMKNGSRIINEADHLACYHISLLPSPTPPRPMDVTLRNQFGTTNLTTTESYMLCVPSKKIVIREDEK